MRSHQLGRPTRKQEHEDSQGMGDGVEVTVRHCLCPPLLPTVAFNLLPGVRFKSGMSGRPPFSSSRLLSPSRHTPVGAPIRTHGTHSLLKNETDEEPPMNRSGVIKPNRCRLLKTENLSPISIHVHKTT